MGNLNELEPFLESTGLDPEKVEEVLPFVQMPLNEEQGLLRNVEILEGMGISIGSLWDVLEQNKQLLAMAPADLRATVDFLEGLGVKWWGWTFERFEHLPQTNVTWMTVKCPFSDRPVMELFP
ncbi:unnamed protein product [Calypogeia fissa]